MSISSQYSTPCLRVAVTTVAVAASCGLAVVVSFLAVSGLLAVGLLVSLFQAITQVHEATLSFVPKLIAAIAVFAIAGPWMMTTLVDFIRNTLLSIPDYAI